MTGGADGQGLAVHLHAGQDLMHAFGELLRAEQHALIDGDVDALAELAGGKASLVAESVRLAAERDRFLRAAGLPGGSRGIEAWVGANPGAGAAWAEYLVQARAARELNRTNGMLIAIRLGHTNQALAVLLAGTSNATLTYCADGRTSVAATSRPLGSA